MAHLIDDSKGLNAFVAVAPAWHKLGTILPDGISTRQALTLGGLDYQVVKSPNVHRYPDGTEIISTDSFFNWRTDTKNILAGKIGSDYKVFQNVEALDIVDEILQRGTTTIETAGVIDGGRKAFIVLKYGKDINISGDVTKTYCLICTSHDGTQAIIAMPTNVRVVCNNTLQMAIASKQDRMSIRHTLNASDRLRQALQVLKLLETSIDKTEFEYYKASQKKFADPQAFFDYIGNVFLTPEEIKAFQSGKKKDEVLSTRKQNIISEVLKYSETGTGQQSTLLDGVPTFWTGLNAITGYQTRKKYKSPDDRMESLMFGTGAKVIERATKLATGQLPIQTLKQTTFNLN